MNELTQKKTPEEVYYLDDDPAYWNLKMEFRKLHDQNQIKYMIEERKAYVNSIEKKTVNSKLKRVLN